MRKMLLPLLLLPLFAACDSDPAGPDTSHVGVYTLISVGGDPLPADFVEDEETFQITAGSLALEADGDFEIEVTFAFLVDGATVTETDGGNGTYTRTGNSFVFNQVQEDAPELTGTLSGNRLTVVAEGMSFVFEK